MAHEHDDTRGDAHDSPTEPEASSGQGQPHRRRAPGAASSAARQGARWAADLRDAITPRAFVLVVGVLGLQVAFIASYLGAFHDPTPHRIAVAVSAPSLPAAEQTAAALNAIAGEPVHATVHDSADEARQQVRDRSAYGALVVGTGTQDTLYVSSAEGAAVSEAVAAVLEQADREQARTLVTTDLVPAGRGDGRGLSAFYLTVGWVVGGYLVAAILGISAGERPSTRQRGIIRLGGLVVYSIASGFLGALVAESVLEALSGSFVPLALLGALVVFAVGAFTMAIQTMTGIIGIGIAVLLFVVLGNPSAGGAYPAPLLPPFWRAIGWLLPPGAGTHGVRSVVYFDGAGLARDVVVLAAWALIGTALMLTFAGRRRTELGAPAPG
ncbi:ABC transporter permease [Luteimicrobium xylanilyticum]|uniref:ABC transporter permease n=1 Tax=Luteimicrobium xylanilyticum TaxID=1133546 RepID=UPI000A0135BE|nr:ABC transporter permease [Luteimicrobium xylanilyticum]